MRNIYSFLFLAGISVASPATAQQFVNGSLEPTSTVNPCVAVSNLTYNSQMGGTAYSFGTLSQPPMYGLFFNDSACHDTTAKLGYYALGMDWATSGYTAVALKVNPAMQAGHSYSLSFWYSASLYFSSCNFEVGYSADSSSFGTLINNFFAPGVFVINWQQGTATFIPSITCKWITIQTTSSTQNTSLSPYMYTLLDDFSISGGTSSVGELEVNNGAIRISPNPAKNTASVTFDNSVFRNEVNLSITDVTGRCIQHATAHLAMGANSIELDLETVAAGLYVVNLSNGQTSATQKLVVVK